MLKLLDLFSGIGGFSLGMEATNRIKTIAFVEKDKFCQKVLNKNFKNIPIEEDIRNVKGSNYTADIVSGGFPCQPFSVAGKRRGKDDDRYLWDETIRVVAETKPKWFVGENVEGIINISNGTVLQQIQQDLEKEGFQVQCLVIPASGVGAWHQRKRVWIIGCNVSNSNSNRNTNEIERSNGEKEKVQREHRQKDSSTWEFIRTNSNDVPNTNSGNVETGCERQRRIRQESEGERSSSNATNIRQALSNTNSKGLQGCSLPTKLEREQRQVITKRNTEKQQTWWEAQSSLCGVPDGISYELDKDRTNRIKALGNSIVPLIAYEIGKAIISAEDQSD
jgi:DNA (cytosine-5)-methyltransferase 1